MSTHPIGFFDSGVGGTSIWSEVHALLPYENTIYLADSKNAPYGPKGKERITELSITNTEFLLNKGCKLIVVACNTATTNAIKVLRTKYTVPFIGIEPALKPAALQTQTKTIGILATKGTLSSDLFHKTAHLYSNGIKVIEQEGNGIVELIESGKLHSNEMKSLLELYVKPMVAQHIDHLVLGCTHYAYLVPLLLKILPKHIKIIDSGEAVAKQTKAVLEKHTILNTTRLHPKNTFYTTGNPEILQTLIGDSFTVEQVEL
ncbi:MAG TPA: glutamate racemase [Flavobacteriaceae bacterium]|nr:glutamate racemase [Flavobacteriaceae bacterium]